MRPAKGYYIMVYMDDYWQRSCEGRFSTAQEATDYAAAECGLPWVVVDNRYKPFAFGCHKGQFIAGTLG